MLLLTFILVVLMSYLIREHLHQRHMNSFVKHLSEPKSYPFIGNMHLLAFEPLRNFFKKLLSLFETHRKLWLGPYLLITVSDPNDIKIILNSCLHKPIIYRFIPNPKGLFQASGMVYCQVLHWIVWSILHFSSSMGDWSETSQRLILHEQR